MEQKKRNVEEMEILPITLEDTYIIYPNLITVFIFELFWLGTKFPLNGREPEYTSL